MASVWLREESERGGCEKKEKKKDLTLKERTENDETGLTHCSFGWLSGMKGG